MGVLVLTGAVHQEELWESKMAKVLGPLNPLGPTIRLCG